MRSAVVASGSADETFALGERLGRLLQAGDFVGLVGELGAGKTLFARGVAQGLGAPVDDVTSPTFAIIQTYAGRLPLHHADLYRLRDAAELAMTGYFDLFDSGGALLVEWADKLPGAVPEVRLLVRLGVTGERSRQLDLEAQGARAEALLAAWRAAPA